MIEEFVSSKVYCRLCMLYACAKSSQGSRVLFLIFVNKIFMIRKSLTKIMKIFLLEHFQLYGTSLVSSGQTLYQAASLRLILQSSMLQLFTAESSRELSALRKQVSMFLILLFKLLTQLPFVSFLFLLLPFSIPSLFPLLHPFHLF